MNQSNSIIYSSKPDMNVVPGGWEPNFNVPALSHGLAVKSQQVGDLAYVIDDFLSVESCDEILKLMSSAPSLSPVSVHGMMSGVDNKIGSVRATTWSPQMAERIWSLLSSMNLIGERHMTGRTATDWWQRTAYYDWEPVAVSPMMRYMKYEKGGEHYAHYDAAYIYDDDRYRSLMSIVLYFTNNETGKTRFILDGEQMNKHVSERDYSDWTRRVTDGEVLVTVKPKKGRLLIFDHRMCHDVEPYDGAEGDRIIIRGDLIFKAITE